MRYYESEENVRMKPFNVEDPDLWYIDTTDPSLTASIEKNFGRVQSKLYAGVSVPQINNIQTNMLFFGDRNSGGDNKTYPTLADAASAVKQELSLAGGDVDFSDPSLKVVPTSLQGSVNMDAYYSCIAYTKRPFTEAVRRALIGIDNATVGARKALQKLIAQAEKDLKAKNSAGDLVRDNEIFQRKWDDLEDSKAELERLGLHSDQYGKLNIILTTVKSALLYAIAGTPEKDLATSLVSNFLLTCDILLKEAPSYRTIPGGKLRGSSYKPTPGDELRKDKKGTTTLPTSAGLLSGKNFKDRRGPNIYDLFRSKDDVPEELLSSISDDPDFSINIAEAYYDTMLDRFADDEELAAKRILQDAQGGLNIENAASRGDDALSKVLGSAEGYASEDVDAEVRYNKAYASRVFEGDFKDDYPYDGESPRTKEKLISDRKGARDYLIVRYGNIFNSCYSSFLKKRYGEYKIPGEAWNSYRYQVRKQTVYNEDFGDYVSVAYIAFLEALARYGKSNMNTLDGVDRKNVYNLYIDAYKALAKNVICLDSPSKGIVNVTLIAPKDIPNRPDHPLKGEPNWGTAILGEIAPALSEVQCEELLGKLYKRFYGVLEAHADAITSSIHDKVGYSEVGGKVVASKLSKGISDFTGKDGYFKFSTVSFDIKKNLKDDTLVNGPLITMDVLSTRDASQFGYVPTVKIKSEPFNDFEIVLKGALRHRVGEMIAHEKNRGLVLSNATATEDNKRMNAALSRNGISLNVHGSDRDSVRSRRYDASAYKVDAAKLPADLKREYDSLMSSVESDILDQYSMGNITAEERDAQLARVHRDATNSFVSSQLSKERELARRASKGEMVARNVSSMNVGNDQKESGEDSNDAASALENSINKANNIQTEQDKILDRAEAVALDTEFLNKFSLISHKLDLDAGHFEGGKFIPANHVYLWDRPVNYFKTSKKAGAAENTTLAGEFLTFLEFLKKSMYGNSEFLKNNHNYYDGSEVAYTVSPTAKVVNYNSTKEIAEITGLSEDTIKSFSNTSAARGLSFFSDLFKPISKVTTDDGDLVEDLLAYGDNTLGPNENFQYVYDEDTGRIVPKKRENGNGYVYLTSAEESGKSYQKALKDKVATENNLRKQATNATKELEKALKDEANGTILSDEKYDQLKRNEDESLEALKRVSANLDEVSAIQDMVKALWVYVGREGVKGINNLIGILKDMPVAPRIAKKLSGEAIDSENVSKAKAARSDIWNKVKTKVQLKTVAELQELDKKIGVKPFEVKDNIAMGSTLKREARILNHRRLYEGTLLPEFLAQLLLGNGAPITESKAKKYTSLRESTVEDFVVCEDALPFLDSFKKAVSQIKDLDWEEDDCDKLCEDILDILDANLMDGVGAHHNTWRAITSIFEFGLTKRQRACIRKALK